MAYHGRLGLNMNPRVQSGHPRPNGENWNLAYHAWRLIVSSMKHGM